MRTAHRLLLAATAAVAAVAVTAPAALAQVEVTDEHTTNHCAAVTITNHTPGGGCEVAADTTINNHAILQTHIPGMGETVNSECKNDFEAVIQETGHGFIYNQTLTDENAGSCGIEPCEEATDIEKPWPFHVYEFADILALGVTFCVKPAGSTDGDETLESPCTVAVPFTDDDPPNHHYVFTTLPDTSAGGVPQSRCSENGFVSLTGQWEIDNVAHDEIEVSHG